MQLIVNHYNANEISNALLTTYFYSFINKDIEYQNWHYQSKYITKEHLSIINICNNFTDFQFLTEYLDIMLNAPEYIICKICQNNIHGMEDDDLLSYFINLLRKRNDKIEMGELLWHVLFNNIYTTLAFYDRYTTDTPLDDIVEIVNILWFDYIKKDVEEYYNYVIVNDYFNLHYTDRQKKIIIQSIFKIMSIAMKYYDAGDATIKETLLDRFKKILFTLLRCNKDSDFDIVFQFLVHVVEEPVKYLINYNKCDGLFNILKVLKLFGIKMNSISNASALIMSNNGSLCISTPFELALYIATEYERNFLFYETVFENYEDITKLQFRQINLILFFIENDADFVDTKCANFFFDNFKTFKDLIFVINFKKRQNKMNLKFLAAKAVKKFNINYDDLKSIPFLHNFLTIL